MRTIVEVLAERDDDCPYRRSYLTWSQIDDADVDANGAVPDVVKSAVAAAQKFD